MCDQKTVAFLITQVRAQHGFADYMPAVPKYRGIPENDCAPRIRFMVGYFRKKCISLLFSSLYGWYRMGRSSHVFLSTMLFWCEKVRKPSLP